MSVRRCLQPTETIHLLFKMNLKTSMTVTSFLILVIQFLSTNALKCDRGTYQIRDECCPVCPAGFHVEDDCTKFRNTSCLPCTVGTFMNQPTARRECFICLRCDAASGLSITNVCTTTSDSVCEPLEGFYCVFSKGDTCVRAHRHKSCEPGQYISSKGTSSSDTECSDCTDGTFSDGTFTVCQPHTQCELKNLHLIKAGTASADAECGGNRSNHTGIVVDVAFAVILLLGAVLFFNYNRKWKRNQTTEEKQSAEFSNLESLNGGENIVDKSLLQQDKTPLI